MALIKDLIGWQSAESIGCVVNEPTAAAANATALNAWSSGFGGASDRGLYFTAGDYYISSPWEFDGCYPVAVQGTENVCDIYGSTDELGETSGASRLIGVSIPHVVNFKSGALGGWFSGLQILGFMDYSRAALLDGEASWCANGIYLEDTCGHIRGNSLMFGCLQNGMVCGSSLSAEQTDLDLYSLIAGNHVNAIIRTVSQQSTVHTYGSITQFGCAVGVYSEYATDFSIQNYYMGADGPNHSDIALKVDNSVINSSGFVVQHMRIDGSETNGALMEMTAHSFAKMKIGYLRMPVEFLNFYPGVILRGGGECTIDDGINIPDRFFRGYQASSHYPKFRLGGAKMATDASPALLVAEDAGPEDPTGTCHVKIDGTSNVAGLEDATYELGFFSATQKWTDGELVAETRPDDVTTFP